MSDFEKLRKGQHKSDVDLPYSKVDLLTFLMEEESRLLRARLEKEKREYEELMCLSKS